MKPYTVIVMDLEDVGGYSVQHIFTNDVNKIDDRWYAELCPVILEGHVPEYGKTVPPFDKIEIL